MGSNSQLESRLGKGTKVILIVVGVAAAILADQLRPGWGRSVATTGLVFGAASVMWPQFRAKGWFWATLLPMFTLQCAVLWRYSILRAMIEELDIVAWFVCTLLNFMCVAAVLLILASAMTRRKTATGTND